MFVPLKDENPLVLIPFEIVNVGLIAICVFVFVVFQSGFVLDPGDGQYGYAMIPATFFDVMTRGPNLAAIPEDLTVITYIFLHGGWLHLLSNMLFLWVFGDNIEDAMGHLRYLVFFLLCGAIAGYVHALTDPASQAPLIGASGAVAGVVGAYLMLHPRVKVWVLILWRIPVPIPAFLALGAWIALQFFNVVAASPDDDVAWWAHIGGFAAGAVLIVFFKRRDVPLFDRGTRH